MKKRHLKKLWNVLLGMVLFTLSLAPTQAFAAGNTVSVQIPVQIAYVKGANVPVDKKSGVKTEFTLSAIDQAPLPAKTTLSVTGAGTSLIPQKEVFDAIEFTQPGDYYYQIKPKLVSGTDTSMQENQDMIVRVSVINKEDGSGLDYFLTSYRAIDDAKVDEESGKTNGVFNLLYRSSGDDPIKPNTNTNKPNTNTPYTPSQNTTYNRTVDITNTTTTTTNEPRSATKPNTATQTNQILWYVIGGLAFLGILFLAKRRRTQNEEN